MKSCFQLSEVARRVGLRDEAEAATYVASMIEHEKIRGKIEVWNEKRILVFEQAQTIDEAQMQREFEEK